MEILVLSFGSERTCALELLLNVVLDQSDGLIDVRCDRAAGRADMAAALKAGRQRSDIHDLDRPHTGSPDAGLILVEENGTINTLCERQLRADAVQVLSRCAVVVQKRLIQNTDHAGRSKKTGSLLNAEESLLGSADNRT